MGTALVLLIYAMATGNSLAGWLFLVPLLAVTVLVLQHRSVWVATFLPAMMAFVIVRQRQGKLVGRLAVISLVSAIVLGPLLASGKLSSVTSSVGESAERATSTTSGTFVGRIEGWENLLKKWASGGPRTWAMGESYGSGYARKQQGGREVTFAPHNYFVQLLLRTGVIGLLAFLALYGFMLKRAISLGNEPHVVMTGYTMIGLLVSVLLYYIPYAPTYIHGLVAGLILGLVLQHDKARKQDATPHVLALSSPVGKS
jgi:O-antigen ligase